MALCAAGCEVEPPTEAEVGYHAEMQELLAANATMSQDFAALALSIKEGESTPTDVAKRLDRQFIQSATALADRASEIQPGTQELSDAHALLLTAWRSRADNLAAIQKAYESQDVEALRDAAARELSIPILEARYFREVNVALAPASLTLQPAN